MGAARIILLTREQVTYLNSVVMPDENDDDEEDSDGDDDSTADSEALSE